ncbi:MULTISPECIES: glycosyl hydrolase [unclassified Azospirillum]|uniref:glycosyl hydrolase n=1 Tax=unclassified Azospirillum TaxID=2630922 RepID=UPI000B76610B|nr:MULTISPECIES: glycosyl hydrolase [unclassified Azospirillum]SNT10533.1 Glycosyl hydrolases family 2, sugar binding domain [Azospirillum sp. RU38E]SNT23705.1 Glycosyl hydrolases family 2, sugar binding domain [Azospirillum sp. RU37A]
MRNGRTVRGLAAALLTACLLSGTSALAADALRDGFQAPPAAAKPRVWWHWLGGNVSADGIDKDLAWMNRVGIGGFQLFTGNLETPLLLEKPVTVYSPEWRSMVRRAAERADALGLEMTMAASAGWSETGGPWVKPAQGMKKLVWSETLLEGGKPFKGTLASPPRNSGPFQDMPLPPELRLPPPPPVRGAKPRAAAAPVPTPTHYADVAVLAYRLADGVTPLTALKPRITSSAGDAALLADGRYDQVLHLEQKTPDGGLAWVEYAFDKPVSLPALTLASAIEDPLNALSPAGVVEIADETGAFRELVRVPPQQVVAFPASAPVRTIALPAAKAQRWRFRFDPLPPQAVALPGIPPQTIHAVTEVRFETEALLDRWQAKAAYDTMRDYNTATPQNRAAVPRDQVIDLTAKLRPDGTLDWTPPPGRWQVLRLGYSLTGTKNHPADPEGTGLEVDKLDGAAVRAYLEGYFNQVDQALGELRGANGLKNLLTDSWEAGQANWTPALPAEFKRRRGYDLLPWLPVLTGRIVGSVADSERFLWDFRRTIADLLAEAHFRTIRDFAHEKGLGYYGEAMGTRLPTTGDGLLNKRFTDIPMGEFWQMPPGAPSDPAHTSDIAEAASAAHFYGQNIVAAEALTALPFIPPFTATPAALKPFADRFLARGVNRFVIHTSPHQPLDDLRPGITLGPFGQFFTRHETWAEQAGPWMQYLARSSFLQQQGRNVADVAWFYGEGAAVAPPDPDRLPLAVPAGNRLDFVGRDAVTELLAVKDGQWLAPSGATYRLLVIPPGGDGRLKLSLPVLTRLRDLLGQGGAVLSPRPIGSPSLGDDAVKVAALIQEIWGPDGASTAARRVGQGRLYPGADIAAALADLNVGADLTVDGAADADIVWSHRRTEEADIWFIANQKDRAETVTLSLRGDGKDVSLWHADSGKVEPASYRQQDGRTLVPLTLLPHQAVFIVQRGAAPAPARTVSAPVEVASLPLAGGWTLRFPAGQGTPDRVALPALGLWTERAEPAIRHFAGTATYETTVTVPADWKGKPVELDLGTVKELASVSINGQPVGTAWKPPFRLEVGAALQPGENRISIAVSNLWPNRIAGDAAGVGGPVTANTHPLLHPDPKAPLLPSGLAGPVRLVRMAPQGDRG